MVFEPFRMERWQSLHEHEVDVNLSDSGIHPLSVRELLGGDAPPGDLLDCRLAYTQTNGTRELRRRVAELYGGADEDDVLIVNGGAEANFLAAWSLVRPGDEVVLMTPNYQQLEGLARERGATLRPWHLRPDFGRGRWTADLDELRALVGPKTALVALCNPSNPTGHCLDATTLDAVCEIAAEQQSWVLCDEIYRGSELEGGETPTAFGRYERALVTSSLSKSYGLPGLRLGWVAANATLCADLWARHDYTTIAPGALSDFLARIALEPSVRERLLARTRSLLSANYALARDWLHGRAREGGPSLQHVPPRAGAMLWVRYEHPVASAELAERLRTEKSLLVVPGAHYDMEGWLRIAIGGEARELELGLGLLGELLDSLS